MNVFKKLTALVLGCMLSTMALAESKVAIFNPQAAILNTVAAKRALDALEADSEYAAMMTKFESLRAELMNMEKDAQANSMTWSEDQKNDYRKKAEYKSADLKLAAEKLKAEKNAAIKRLMQDMVPKAKDALSQIVTAENIGLVLDSSVAHYAMPSYDITAKVTDKINKAN